jgi:ceramide glucosyltransferase
MNASDWNSYLVTLGDVSLVLAVLGGLVALVQCVLVLRYAGQDGLPTTTPSPVTVLKPLHGAEPDLAARLAAYCAQDYDGPVQLVFGTRNDAKSPADAVHELKAAFPEQAIDLVVDTRSHGSNRKISNLINMLPSAHYDTLVLSDSDIVIAPDYLRGITAALRHPQVGAVTCLYYGIGTERWSRLSALAINSHFLPNAIMGMALGLAHHCCGATIALRRSMLDRIGGFAAFADVLADDYAIGAAVRSLGYEIATAPFLVGHSCFETSLRQFFLHQLRIARTIRSIEPLGYAGTIVNHPWPLALIGLLSGSPLAFATAAAALATRVALCRCVERRFKLPRQDFWLVAAQDTMAFAVYLVSFFGMSVHWQGSDYRVTADGNMIERES